MDLNQAISAAEAGAKIRDDATMKPDWTVQFDKEAKALFYYTPNGTKAHKIIFHDGHRASFQWRIMS